MNMDIQQQRDTLASPPYPWFGGKSSVADLIWERFGDCPNYVEPFFGGGAVWRLRPHWPFDESVIRRETINDYDGHVANFWRAVQADPDAVAKHLDWPVNEIDLHSRGDWLFCRPESKEFIARMRSDPEYFCAKTAGWWCWFVANWIGGLPSVEENAHRTADAVYNRRPHIGGAGNGVSRKLPHLGSAGMGVSRQLPHLGDAGKGVSRKRPHLGNAGKGVSRKRPHLGDAGQGACERQSESLREWMRTLTDRLRHVRVCCGDWSRVCGLSVTWNNAAPCAVMLDPPYSLEAGRDNSLYSAEDLSVAHACREWCLAEGARDDMRICLCGYSGEGHEILEQHDWEVIAWKTKGGYANQGKWTAAGIDNARRERMWFSPGCLKPVKSAQMELFA